MLVLWELHGKYSIKNVDVYECSFDYNRKKKENE